MSWSGDGDLSRFLRGAIMSGGSAMILDRSRLGRKVGEVARREVDGAIR